MRAQLTKKLVTSAQPQDRPYELRDISIPGLIFRVQPSGYKAWIIEWSRGKRRTLGAFGHLTLEQARAHAAQAIRKKVSIATSLPIA
ncbi:Arm DNA-binding domain-containing protein [Luteimonas sp. SX5]|uniref:Arm DNA-binding domain-containing protein n=1 Tax=Luteimonas galliterrae TaxID=2940486 RepID=A0ABT0MH07_9GAMM|nr:Arm DNA-binding domain-containing protein [Luteimonas galliterrae]MCL1633953.1 Arm DNA-binding domain-containing protein [Luteimonas galliterrae]